MEKTKEQKIDEQALKALENLNKLLELGIKWLEQNLDVKA